VREVAETTCASKQVAASCCKLKRVGQMVTAAGMGDWIERVVTGRNNAADAKRLQRADARVKEPMRTWINQSVVQVGGM
jgi:hypothetical protein